MSWIEIPGWDRFQHYGLYRRPLWIKNYTELLRKDEYLDLPLAARGLLHGIWLAYADREGRLRKNDLPAVLLARARDAHLASLNDAGLIAFSASRPLSLNLKPVTPVEPDADGKPTASRPADEAYRPTDEDDEPYSAIVDDDMLQLARGWLEAHRA